MLKKKKKTTERDLCSHHPNANPTVKYRISFCKEGFIDVMRDGIKKTYESVCVSPLSNGIEN